LTVRIAQPPGHRFLLGKKQLVLATTGQLMHLKAHPPQKIIGLFQPQSLLARQPGVVRHGVEVRILQKNRTRPADELQVAQPANPFFNMRLEQIGGLAELTQPLLPVAGKFLQKSAAAPGTKTFQERLAPGLIQPLIPSNEACFQVAGEDRKILPHQLPGFGQRSRRMSHLKAGIPKTIGQLTDHLLQGWDESILV